MKPYTLWIAAALLGGCDTQVADYEDCLDRYVVPAGTDAAADRATAFCRRITGDGQAPEDVAFARCMLPKMSEVNTDAGIDAAARVCRSR